MDRFDGNPHEKAAYRTLDYLETAAFCSSTELPLLTPFSQFSFDLLRYRSQFVRLFMEWRLLIEGRTA